MIMMKVEVHTMEETIVNSNEAQRSRFEIQPSSKVAWPEQTFYNIGCYDTRGVGWRWTSGEYDDYKHPTTQIMGHTSRDCTYAYTKSSIGWNTGECDNYDTLRVYAVCQRSI